MSIEAMKQALEALKEVNSKGYAAHWYKAFDKQIAALRQAIEQAEKTVPSDYSNSHQQEPVIGTKTWFEDGKMFTQHLYPSDIYEYPQPEQEFVTQYSDIVSDGGLDPRNTAPVHASDISQKRVDETAKDRHELAGTMPISNGGIATRTPSSFISPPKREWVGLTDEEVGGLTVFNGLTQIEVPILADFVRAVEAKLKEKNT